MSPLPVTFLLLLAAYASADGGAVIYDGNVFSCARLYYHKDYNNRDMIWVNIEDGEEYMNMDDEVGRWAGGWEDEVSSVRVKQGCILAVWWDKDQEGAHMDITSDIPDLHDEERDDGKDWNDKISSVRCYCSKLF